MHPAQQPIADVAPAPKGPARIYSEFEEDAIRRMSRFSERPYELMVEARTELGFTDHEVLTHRHFISDH